MKKRDLKSKMFVELRNGARGIIVEDALISNKGASPLYEHDENLNYKGNEHYDIMKIYKYTNEHHTFTNNLDVGIHWKEFNFESDKYTLLWKRKEMPKLSYFEKDILKSIDESYVYIQRIPFGEIFIAREDETFVPVNGFNNLFSCLELHVKYEIKELLKN